MARVSMFSVKPMEFARSVAAQRIVYKKLMSSVSIKGKIALESRCFRTKEPQGRKTLTINLKKNNNIPRAMFLLTTLLQKSLRLRYSTQFEKPKFCGAYYTIRNYIIINSSSAFTATMLKRVKRTKWVRWWEEEGTRHLPFVRQQRLLS